LIGASAMEKLQRIQNMTVTVQIRFGKKEKYPFYRGPRTVWSQTWNLS
jgi:hypothetical protein